MSHWGAAIENGWTRFVGPEATRLNNTIAIGSAIAGSVGAALWAKRRGVGSGAAASMAVLAADAVGGAYVNNTRASVRWYERAGQATLEHVTFAALHVHPAVVAWTDHRIGARRRPLAWTLAHYGYMVGATVIIRSCPVHRRWLGLTLTVGGLVLDCALGQSRAAPWFAWAYYPKLLMGHAAGSLWPDQDLDGLSRSSPLLATHSRAVKNANRRRRRPGACRSAGIGTGAR